MERYDKKQKLKIKILEYEHVYTVKFNIKMY